MSFIAAAALAVGLFVLAPFVAHLLRRGRTPERVFPPAALVSRLEAHSKERSRLEDRGLLSLRMAIVVVLALLGATPLVRCSRLSVDRPHGASVALALVIDDSHSMLARNSDGERRWDAAIEGGRQLLRSLREGDSVAIVLAGKPARLALSATTDLTAARGAIEELRPSDRSSDLENALKLAESAIKNLQQPDRKKVVLSDLAGVALDAPDVEAPLESLRAPVDDCGLVAAGRTGDRLKLTMACSAAALGPRSLRIVAKEPAAAILADPSAMTRLSLEPRAGSQTLSFGLTSQSHELELELTPPDQNPTNDRVHVSQAGAQLNVAVITEASDATVITGGPTVIEQALGAVRPEIVVRPLSMLPDETSALQSYAALIVNDPPGLGPESRAALSEWLERGGVALGLLGPASSGLQLSSTLEPFAERSARWEHTEVALDVEPASLSWLGQEARSLLGLTRGGRTRLDGAGLPGSVQVGSWKDGVPFLLRRSVGAGLVLTAGLPAAVEHSDFALRPGFLALLDQLLREAEQRRGPAVTWVGERWTFAPGKAVSITGPSGPVEVAIEGCDGQAGANPDCSPGQQGATPVLAGKYSITTEGVSQVRVARLDEREITDPPGSAVAARATAGAGGSAGSIDASPELALALLLLFAAELALRVASEARRRRRTARALA